MSFISRVGKSLGGLFDVVEAPVDFGWDVGKAMFDDGARQNGFWSSVWSSFQDRGAKMVSGAIGPEGFGGQLFGAIPDSVRHYPSLVLKGTTGGMSVDKPGFGWDEAFGGGLLGLLDGFGREFIREPIATAVTVASLGESNIWKDGGGDASFKAFFDKKAWSRAHEISQHRSLGQSIAAAILTKDILDPDEMLKAQRNPFYGMISGGFDVAARMWLDPDQLLFGAGKALRAEKLGRYSAVASRLGREAEKIDDIARYQKAASRATGLHYSITGEVLGSAEEAAAALRTRLIDPGNTLKIDWAVTESEKAASGGNRFRRVVETLSGDTKTSQLDDALAAARGRDTSPLRSWLKDNEIKASTRQIVKAVDDPEDAYRLIGMQLADKKGINTIHFLDEGGDVLANLSLDLGNRGALTKLGKQTEKAMSKYGDDPYAVAALTKRDYVKSLFESKLAGGWEQLFTEANQDLYKLSARTQTARDAFVASEQWSKTKSILAKLDGLPLSQRTEKIRDRYFHDYADGSQMASFFALASDDASRDAIMRYSLGEFRAIGEITDDALKREMYDVTARRAMVREQSTIGLFGDKIEEYDLLRYPDSWGQAGRIDDVAAASGMKADELVSRINFYSRGMTMPSTRGRGVNRIQDAVLGHIRRNPDGLMFADIKTGLAAEATRKAERLAATAGDVIGEAAAAEAGTVTRAAAKVLRPTKQTLASLEKKGLITVGEDGLIKPVYTVLNEASPAEIELQRMQQIARSKSDFMKSTLRGSIRSSAFVEQVWESPWNKIRVLFDMTAHPFVLPDSPTVVPQLKRHLRDANFTKEQQEMFLGRYAQVDKNPALQQQMLDQLRSDAVKAMGERYLSHLPEVDRVKYVEAVVEKVKQAQGAGARLLEQAQVYAGTGFRDGKEFNWSRVPIHDAEGTHYLHLPMTPAQLQNAYVMPNFAELDKAMKRSGEVSLNLGYRTFDHLTNLPTTIADSINRAWKPLVLLRPAWPIRVVFDEQIRMMSVMGVMERLSSLKTDFRELKHNYIRDIFHATDGDKNAFYLGTDSAGRLGISPEYQTQKLAKAVADPGKAARGLGVAGAAAGFAVAGPVGAVAGGAVGAWRGYRNAEFANGLQALYLSSTRNLAVDGYHLAMAMGHPGAVANVYRQEISAGRDLAAIMQKSPSEELNRIRFDRNRWTTYRPEDAGYAEMWNNAVNHQYANSRFTQMAWDPNVSNEAIVEWLTSPGEGAATLNRMPLYRQRNPEQWVESVRGFMDDNLLPVTPETMPLRQALARGETVSLQQVKKTLGDEWSDTLRSVNGQQIIEIQDSRSELARMGRGMVDRMMNHLGKTPTDTLSREPFFEFQYVRNAKEQVAAIRSSMGGENLVRMSESEIMALEDQARRVALHDTRTLLYDLAEQSKFGEIVRHVMPFYNAWQEVLTRYAGIAMDNPAYLSRVMKVYGGLDEIGDTYTDEGTGQKVQRLRIPEWAKGMINQGIFASALDDQGYIAFDKSSLNMLASGIPSFGPIVTATVGAATGSDPELIDSMKFMFPFGPARGVVDQFGPSWLKRVVSGTSEDQSFQATRLRIVIDKMAQADIAGVPLDLSTPEKVVEFQRQVTTEAKHLYALRTVAALVMPVAPQFQSPYQDYLDVWRKLQREDPKTAEMRFLQQYGEGYFRLTQSLSKVYDGVPATAKGEEIRDKYLPLIQAYPELGTLIMGDEGGGTAVQFSRAIYDQQFNESLSPGSTQTRRAHFSMGDVMTQPDVRRGWQEWTQFNDWLTDQMQRTGVTSLQSKAGTQLGRIKDAQMAVWQEKNPAWFLDFNDRDTAKWIKRMDGMEAVATTSNQDLFNRPDIAGLRDYLDARRVVEAELARREAKGGSATLTAKSNKDVAYAWEVIQHQIVENNTMFANLHSRWLANDPVDKPSWLTRG